MINYLNNNSFNWLQLKESVKKEDETRDELVTDLIGLLSNRSIESKEITYSEELESVAKILNLISDALDEEIISKSQAENLVRYIMSGVVSRRVNNMFDNLLSANDQSKWFLAASHKFEREDW